MTLITSTTPEEQLAPSRAARVGALAITGTALALSTIAIGSFSFTHLLAAL